MPRPKKLRLINFFPKIKYFGPSEGKSFKKEEIILSLEELEAVRLKDLEGLSQEKSAQKMKVSDSTFQRVLWSARKKIAKALVEGRFLKIEGGNFCFKKRWRHRFGRK